MLGLPSRRASRGRPRPRGSGLAPTIGEATDPGCRVLTAFTSRCPGDSAPACWRCWPSAWCRPWQAPRFYLNHLRDTALRDAYRAADLVAIGTSERLRWLLQDAEAMLASVAARPKVRTVDPTDCDPILAEFRAISPAFKTLALRLTDGRSLCSELPQPPSQQSVAASPWFQAAIRRPGFHVSDGHLGAVQQRVDGAPDLPREGRVGPDRGAADHAAGPAAVAAAPVRAAAGRQPWRPWSTRRTGCWCDRRARTNAPASRRSKGWPRVIDALRQEARHAGVAAPVSRQFRRASASTACGGCSWSARCR